MRRTLRCSSPSRQPVDDDFANFEAFITPRKEQQQQRVRHEETTKLTYGNPSMQFGPSLAVSNRSSDPFRVTPSSPATSGSSSYVAWPSSSSIKGPQLSTKAVDVSRQTATTSVASSFEDVETSWEHHNDRSRDSSRSSRRYQVSPASTAPPLRVARAVAADYYPDPDISVGMEHELDEDEDVFEPRLSEDALFHKDRLETRVYNTPLAKGFPGLLDKTKEVPCLMDATETVLDDSDDYSLPREQQLPFRELHNMETTSDVFDGITPTQSDVFENLSPIRPEFSMVRLPGGLSAIQTTAEMFRNRAKSTVSSSDGSSSTLPDHKSMVSAGRRMCDNAVYGIQSNLTPTRRRHEQDEGSYHRINPRSLEDPRKQYQPRTVSPRRNHPFHQRQQYRRHIDWNDFLVSPESTQELVRVYRQRSQDVAAHLSFSDLEINDDERKVFALFEMRSRVMQSDVERGLERRGGTIATDDIITTDYYRTSHRIRDALVVSKAWRDGATVADVIHTEQLTKRHAVHFVRRVNQRIVTFEPVHWKDDTDFQQYRCPSLLAGRHLRGSEMFSIGDCQSILLKLTNDRCMELRDELNRATARQIDAEEQMKDEGDHFDGIMSDAEMRYLSAMEEVKVLSRQLVGSEQAYALVRERIESLLSKYEKLLSKIETESFTGASSVVTDSTFCSEYNTSEYWDQMDRMWARRAKRAELQAELAARQVLLDRQQSNAARQVKRREIDALQKKLDDIRSDSQPGLDHRRTAAQTMKAPQRDPPSKNKVESVKQRFRDRMAQRQHPRPVSLPQVTQQPRKKLVSLRTPEERNLLRSAGEEMCAQMDFYERSLRAVDTTHRT